MFLSNEWVACVYSTKQDGQAIAQLVKHDQRFWSGVGEVCAISEPLVMILRLVYGEKPLMGYLYEAMVGPRKLSTSTMRTRGRKDSPRELKYGV